MITNTRESMLDHESKEYIESRPRWVVGRVPSLSDYRKLSVDDMKEALTLAKIGQLMAEQFIPTVHGKPLKLYFTQALIVGAAVLTREVAEKYGLDYDKYRSVLMVTPSRYGKSFLNAVACIIMAAGAGKEVQIGGATTSKANIIQNKIIELLPNATPEVLSGLIVAKDESVDDALRKVQRLSTAVSKESLRWTNGGSINLFSTNEVRKNADVAAAGAIGIGGDYAVFDEIQLMTPVGFRTASRFMVENPDTKRFCVGNPMINGHFKELYDSPNTFVIHANDITTIVEERMTRYGFQLTDMPTYSQEYRAFIETEFPDERSGTRFFPTLPQLWDPPKLPTPQRKTYFMGIDSAYQGGDSIIATLLSLNEGEGKVWFAVEECVDVKKKFTNWDVNTNFEVALELLKIWQSKHVVAGCIDIGFGVHIYEKMRELVPEIALEPINNAQRPTEDRIESDYNARFAQNMRAELHLDMRDLCSNDLLYVNAIDYEEVMKEMREVGQSPEGQKIKIEPKKDIKARLGRSPDYLDSITLAVHAMILSGILSGGDGEIDTDVMMEVIGGEES